MSISARELTWKTFLRSPKQQLPVDTQQSSIIPCKNLGSSAGLQCSFKNSMIFRFSVPATTSIRNLKAKIDQARKQCLHVDCAFWGECYHKTCHTTSVKANLLSGGVTGENNAELLPLSQNGVCGFKAYLNPQDSYPDFPHLTKDSLKKALDILEETDCIFAVDIDLEISRV